MNVAETVTATSADQDYVEGTITVADNTVVVAVVAATTVSSTFDASLAADASTTGWTRLYHNVLGVNLVGSGRHQYGLFYKEQQTAGDATLRVNTSTASGTTSEMVIHLLEIGGGTFVDDYAAVRNENTSTYVPETASDGAIVVSRGGNLGVFSVVFGSTASNLAPPTDYSTAAESDVDSGSYQWSLCTYYKELPYSTAYEAQAAVSGGTFGALLIHAEVDTTASASALFGDF